MTIEHFFIHNVTIQRAVVVTNRYGDNERIWASPTESTVKGWLGRRNASEPDDAGRSNVLVTEDVLFLPAATDIEAGDRVEVLDRTFEVDGNPLDAWTPRGLHHLEVSLRSTTG